MREYHVRICEGLGVKFPGSTRHELPRHLSTSVSASHPIVLQKSKVAGLRIFRENTKRKAIADSYNLIRVAEVAREFNVRR